ncbi:MAG: hypothetical protein R3D68_19850 [Hyphomicrobiaceae bacterium]
MVGAVIIGVMIVATIATIGFMLAPHMAPQRLVFDARPDRPKPFGYGMAWLAVRTRLPETVLAVLGVEEVERANWNTGLGAVYSAKCGQDRIFVSQPVNGWVMVVGLSLPQPLGRQFADKCSPLLIELGRHFIEIQYFLAYPELDHFAWARLLEGKIVRAFAMGDEGVIWNRGKPSKEEKAMGLRFSEPRGRKGGTAEDLILPPTEAHVMWLAGKWSLDPTRIDTTLSEPGLGYIGKAPIIWRPERLRRVA